MTPYLPASTLFILLIFAGAASADESTVADGVYTEAQADAGDELYRINCLTCHNKRYFRPVLERWEGQSLSTMFTIMSTSMPESNPGSLRRDEYVEILAYILSLSRYPAGDAELDYKDDALDRIKVVPRKR